MLGNITKPVKKVDVKKKWLLIDATDSILGRIASQVAYILRGKNKPSFTTFMDCGDNVIVVNADKIKLTGNKQNEKQYLWHTGYPGGQRTRSIREMRIINPKKILMHAVKGMLPKSKLGAQQLRNLRVFMGPEHNMESVKPEKISLKY